MRKSLTGHKTGAFDLLPIWSVTITEWDGSKSSCMGHFATYKQASDIIDIIDLQAGQNTSPVIGAYHSPGACQYCGITDYIS